MTSETAGVSNSPAPPVGPMGARSVGGLAWLLGDTVASKLLSFVANAILTHLLVPAQFGLFATALAILTICELTSRAGVRDIIITRYREFGSLSTTAVTFTAVAGVLSSAALLGIGLWFIAGGGVATGSMIVAISPSPLLTAVGIVPEAMLSAQMRFRHLAAIQVVRGVLRAGLSIALVLLGLGTFGLVFALLISAAVGTALLWAFARPDMSSAPKLSTLREMLPSMSWLFGAGLIATLGAQGDYLVLGWIAGQEQVGLYFIAFSLGNQILLIFAMNMGRVLLPAMSQLSEVPERQSKGLLDACGALALLGGIVCALQVALAEPFIRGLLSEEYAGAAFAMSVLAFGMFFRLMSFTVVPFIKSTGRFKTLFWLQFALVADLLALAAVGSWLGKSTTLGGAAGCALGVAVASVVTGVVAPVVALRPTNHPPFAIARVVWVPFLCGAVAAAIAWAPGLLLPDDRTGSLLHLVAGTVLGTLAYAALATLLIPQRVGSTLTRLRPVARRVPAAGRALDIVLERLRVATSRVSAHATTD